MTIKAFCESHNVQIQAVSMYISRHADLFEGLLVGGSGDKRSKELTDAAVKILEKKYPIPEPVAVYNHHPEDLAKIEAQEEQIRQLTIMMSKAQELIARQQEHITSVDSDIAKLEATQKLLEDKSTLLEEEKARANQERKRAEQAVLDAHEAEKALQRAEIERDYAMNQADEAAERAARAESETERIRQMADQTLEQFKETIASEQVKAEDMRKRAEQAEREVADLRAEQARKDSRGFFARLFNL